MSGRPACTHALHFSDAAERPMSARDALQPMQVLATSLQRALKPRQAAAVSDRWMGVMQVHGHDENDSHFRRFEVRSSPARGCWVALHPERTWPGQRYS
jgi:hypothetical protein